MLSFIYDAQGKLHSVQEHGTNARRTAETIGGQVSSRWDFTTFDVAEKLAADATKLTGTLYIAIDNGPNVSPRYDIVRAPKVGDKVSYGFNGDYYPDGEITNISASLRIVTTSTGRKYYRRRLTDLWLERGMWALVQGHIDERNPEF